MDSTQGGLTIEVIIISMAIVFIFALVVIVFFVVYQRRLLKQEKEQQAKELIYQKELLKASIEGQENERLRIAKDLHDDVGTMLTTARVYFEQFSTKSDTESRDKLSAKMNELLGSTIQSVRDISHDLRPVILEKLGLNEAIRALAKTLNETGEMQVQFTSDGEFHLSKEQNMNLYRIIQELIANTLKHARAKHISIKFVSESDQLRVIYKDDGIGTNLSGISSKKGIGMKNIESRLSVLAGEIEYLNPTKGFHVEIQVPQT